MQRRSLSAVEAVTSTAIGFAVAVRRFFNGAS